MAEGQVLSDDTLVNSRSREQVIHALYEAAELEHNLMCTYLYTAFSLKTGPGDGLSPAEAESVMRWRGVILAVAIDEMSHLTAVWNITAALGAAPRFGRTNFPLDPGYLPANVVVRLAPFSEAVLQHFIHLERPHGAAEEDGAGFAPERQFVRSLSSPRLTPLGADYETVGAFYQMIGRSLRALVERVGEDATFCGDPALQLSTAEIDLAGARPVRCLKTALAALDSIIAQGEGAPSDSAQSHFQKFIAIRDDLHALKAANPLFVPAVPAAHNPVFRRPPRPEGRVWIENPEAAEIVDLANALYGLMLRLLAYAYTLPSPAPQKAAAVDLALGLMHGLSPLAEAAARLPAGPSNPTCNAGISFVALRDAAALPSGTAAWRFFVERLDEMLLVAEKIEGSAAAAAQQAASLLRDLAARARREAAAAAGTAGLSPAAISRVAPLPAASGEPLPLADAAAGIESVQSDGLVLIFEGKRCIHARFCVTGAPRVFLANVKGPWLHPETMDSDDLAAVARECPSGAIRYHRKDGRPDEAAPPVNLISVRENGPYAVRAALRLNAVDDGFRATLCRCGASKNKPYCDGSHFDAGFVATGEPPSGATGMLPVRDGPLLIDPQTDGPLHVRGNIEIISGTGRVVARQQSARLCRCGASATKPFCDGSHVRVGFKS